MGQADPIYDVSLERATDYALEVIERAKWKTAKIEIWPKLVEEHSTVTYSTENRVL